ncbi:26091_t:CDS:2 [Dentiscutata erythropus]|uniref:26091_t:CDS:1 n=1 Tax=Dentiscutata erythropus TaxID=1348616 RepID=A0A9N9E527_9GLOM|nr:26091_t:CDS:2 [Dentiscutata erythropus]
MSYLYYPGNLEANECYDSITGEFVSLNSQQTTLSESNSSQQTYWSIVSTMSSQVSTLKSSQDTIENDYASTNNINKFVREKNNKLDKVFPNNINEHFKWFFIILLILNILLIFGLIVIFSYNSKINIRINSLTQFLISIIDVKQFSKDFRKLIIK